jgi:hypothetical protein
MHTINNFIYYFLLKKLLKNVIMPSVGVVPTVHVLDSDEPINKKSKAKAPAAKRTGKRISRNSGAVSSAAATPIPLMKKVNNFYFLKCNSLDSFRCYQLSERIFFIAIKYH